jgi:hypothetical protein
MILAKHQEEKLVSRLQRALPVTAYGKPALMNFLRNRLSIERTSPRLTVTNVFSARDGGGLMCQFVVSGARAGSHPFVAPITQLSFDRRHPIASEVTSYAKRREAVASFPRHESNRAPCSD